ncbi:MAG: CopG family transcriptional regulator [Candidatus Thermoplasmatota archaeon]|nr:CopG family transcriptional regulator [Candidatus Thermoplasmatota archaeon]
MNEKKEKEYANVKIPTALAKKIKKRIEGTEFTSISSYVTYILGEILSDAEEKTEETFTKEDEEKVKNRLRALGYLD